MRKVFEYFLDYDDMREKWWNIAIPDLAGVSLEVANMAYDRAHADGHANGYREVANRMIDEFDYAKRLFELSKK